MLLLDCSVDVGGFVTGLSQISSFFSSLVFLIIVMYMYYYHFDIKRIY